MKYSDNTGFTHQIIYRHVFSIWYCLKTRRLTFGKLTLIAINEGKHLPHLNFPCSTCLGWSSSKLQEIPSNVCYKLLLCLSLCNSRYCIHVLLYPLTYILFTIVSYPLLWMIWRSYPQWVQLPNERLNSTGFDLLKGAGYCSVMTDKRHLSLKTLLGSFRRFLITSLTFTCRILC